MVRQPSKVEGEEQTISQGGTHESIKEKPSSHLVLAISSLFICTFCWPAAPCAILATIYAIQVCILKLVQLIIIVPIAILLPLLIETVSLLALNNAEVHLTVQKIQCIAYKCKDTLLLSVATVTDTLGESLKVSCPEGVFISVVCRHE